MLAVAAGRLGLVKRGVGVLEQVRGIGRVGRIEADADAGRAEDLGAGELGGHAQGRAHALGHRIGGRAGAAAVAAELDVGEQDRELVAAQPRHGAGLGDRLAQPPRDLLHERVAGLVAEAVVHDLEVVEVDEQHGDAVVADLGARHRALQVLLEHGPVRQAGERVVQGDVGELLLGVAVGGHVEQVALPARLGAVCVAHLERLVEHPGDAAVGPHDPVLGREAGAVGDRRGELAEHAPAVVGMDAGRGEPGIALPVGGGAAGDRLDGGAPVERRRGVVERIHVDAERQLLDQRAIPRLGGAQPRLGLVQRLLGVLAVGDVEDHALHLGRDAVLVADDDHLVVEPALAALGVEQPVLVAVRRRRRERRAVAGHGAVAVVGMHPRRPAVGAVEPLGDRDAAQRLELGADIDRVAAADAVDIGDRGHLLDERLEAAQRLVRVAVKLGVSHGGGDRLAEDAPEAHAARREIGVRRAGHLDEADGLVAAHERHEEVVAGLAGTAIGDHRGPVGVEVARLGRLGAEREHALASGVHEPDAGAAADHRRGMRVEAACDLVGVERREEGSHEREQRVLAAGVRHRPVIGRSQAALESDAQVGGVGVVGRLPARPRQPLGAAAHRAGRKRAPHRDAVAALAAVELAPRRGAGDSGRTAMRPRR